MINLKVIKNEDGLTLLEVLLSIVILTIILVSIMNYFPQMGKINKQNESKLVTVNMMKEVLHDWKNSDQVIKFLKSDDPNKQLKYEIIKDQTYIEKEDHYEFTGKDESEQFKIEVKIAKKSQLEGKIKTHLTHIIFKDNSGLKISETYGYVVYEADSTEEGA